MSYTYPTKEWHDPTLPRQRRRPVALEDHFDLAAYRSPNPGRYAPSEEELARWEVDQQELEDWREYQAEKRAAQNGTL